MSSFERIGRNNEEKKGLVLPNMADMLTLKEEIINLFFPGLSGGEYPDELLSAIHFHYNNVVKLLADSVLLSYAYEDKGKSDSDVLEKKTKESMDKLLYALPMIRKQLKLDANAALDGDPAAKSLHEVILSYPSLRALSIHRVSHFLYVQKVPLVPRMLNELVHQETGIDIHPGAEIGKSFFNRRDDNNRGQCEALSGSDTGSALVPKECMRRDHKRGKEAPDHRRWCHDLRECNNIGGCQDRPELYNRLICMDQ